MLFQAFLLSWVPGLFWLLYVESRAPRRSSLWRIALTFLAGGLSVSLVFAFHHLLDQAGWGMLGQVPTTPLAAAGYFVVLVGLLEESCKLLACALVCLPRADFRESWDGVCCASSVALGFATVENFKYVVETGQPTVLIGRFLLSTFAHVVMSGLWGYALGWWRSGSLRSMGVILGALGWAAFLHGAYDWFLWVGLWPGALLVYAGLITLFRHRLQESYFASQQRWRSSEQVRECQQCRGLSRAEYYCCSQCGGRELSEARVCLACLAPCQSQQEQCTQCSRTFL